MLEDLKGAKIPFGFGRWIFVRFFDGEFLICGFRDKVLVGFKFLGLRVRV